MRKSLRSLGVFSACAVLLLAGRGVVAAPPGEQAEFFEKRVRPLLVEHCYECHSGATSEAKASLRVDYLDGLLDGGDSGAAIVPGHPDESLLIEAVRYESYEMPPRGKLADDEIAALERWIEDGAYWPEGETVDPAPAGGGFDLAARKASHWAWQPIAHVDPPQVSDASWPRAPMDRFILAGLEANGIRPAPPKAKRALVRRVYFDLIGLPPTPSEIDAFVADDRPDALARVVDRLLASERFGERWGRHWLDLMRYAESRGHEFDYDIPNAYQYRDYVIRAFNADVPYDQFIREHLAGDLLSEPRLNPQHGFNESVLGPGFWHLGEWVHSPVDTRKDEADRFDNMIDVMTKSMLGMTVSCARCHDHKFDAISSHDYHALAGFLQSSDYRQVRFEAIEQNRRVADRLAEIDREFRSSLRKTIARGLTEETVATLGEAVRDSDVTDTATYFADCRVLVDYGREASLMQDGYVFGAQPHRPGDLRVVALEEGPALRVSEFAAAATDPFWTGIVNQTEAATNGAGDLDPAKRSGRTLRTATVDLTTGEVACLVRGHGQAFACVDSHRMLHGPLHRGTFQSFAPPEDSTAPHWVKIDLRRYAGGRVHFEFTPVDDKPLEVLAVVEGAPPEGEPASRKAGPPSRALFSRWASEGIETAGARGDLAAAARLIVGDPSKYLSAEGASELHALAEAWASARRGLRSEVRHESRLALAMMDLSGEDDHRLIRGNTNSPAEAVRRRFLEAVDGDAPLPIAQGSGRLELADRINARENPLTARVIVNRIWRHLLGEGIVPTPDNFGVLGELPTHPELLDHLATEFVENGQSIKAAIRSIVLSSTYAMSSEAAPEVRTRDPLNKLWSRVPPKRLEAEPLRDTLLMLSGKFDPTMFGESTPVHLTDFMTGRGRPKENGPRDGAGRRSVYLEVRRNFLSPRALTFDAPTPFSTMGRRTRANVPAQALVLLNDPLVHECATQWAKLMLTSGVRTVPERVEAIFYEGLGRPPEDDEMKLMLAFVESEASARALPESSPEVWASVAHALINTKEFVYLQ